MTDQEFYEKAPTVEEMRQAISSLEGDIKSRREGIQYRWENYINCVDDYSSGGICDKAANEAISEAKRKIETYENQIAALEQTGKCSLIQEDHNFALTDLDGNIVSERIVNTRYGSAWIIDENGGVKFVSLAKKLSTYNKKGYSLMQRDYKTEYYFPGNYFVSRVVEQTSTIVTEEKLNFWVGTDLGKITYFALQNEEVIV